MEHKAEGLRFRCVILFNGRASNPMSLCNGKLTSEVHFKASESTCYNTFIERATCSYRDPLTTSSFMMNQSLRNVVFLTKVTSPICVVYGRYFISLLPPIFGKYFPIHHLETRPLRIAEPIF